MPDNCLDFVRLVLAMMVVIAHYLLLTDIPGPREWAPFFDPVAAVSGFFILSGLLVSRSWLASRSGRSYLFKRARRLLPAYVTVVLLCGIFLSLLSSFSFQAYYTHPGLYRYLLYNLSFLNFLAPQLPGVFTDNPLSSVNGSLWTLKIEVCFYLFLPLILSAGLRLKTKKAINWYFLTLYLLGILYTLCCDAAYRRSGNWFYQEIRHQLPGQLPYFIAGCAAWFNIDWVMRHLRKLLLPAVVFFGERYFFGTYYIWPVALTVLVLFLAFKLPALQKITGSGDISYGVYLFHYPIAQCLIAAGVLDLLSLGWTFVLYLFLVLSAAILSWFFIEKPFLNRSSHRRSIRTGP